MDKEAIGSSETADLLDTRRVDLQHVLLVELCGTMDTG